MSKNILKKDKNFIWHPFTQLKTAPDPILIKEAKDDTLIDIDGKKYIDLISSWWVNIHGHGKKEINDEIYKQANTIDQIIFAGLTHEPAVTLAEKLVNILPKGLKRVFYSDNGSTSVEIALKVSYQYWFNKGKERRKFISFKGGYHGDTLGAMSVGYSTGFYKPFKNLTFKPDFISYPDNWKGNNMIEVQEKKALSEIDEILKKESDDIAAVIVEPMVQGAAGMKICRPEFLNKIVKKFQEKKIIVIFDEVMTGFGRTGKMFASEHLKVNPDIICLAKSLTGGILPLAATVFKEYIHDAFVDLSIDKSFLHGHSFSANSIACSAALASLQIFEREKTFLKIKRIEEIHKNGLEKLTNNELVCRTRFLGTIAAFDIVGFDTGYGAKIGETLKKVFLEKGYIIRPLGETLYLMPPYCIQEHKLENVYNIINKELKKI
ncbi:MAG: adenosylmethionine--8-amino-7-oxononanoate transaminase [Rickettsiales bacterium]|nr:adenosylmethionine--8-amino-7-oxononanoate transaminase [Rickettsiales bacterium]|tara:strand:- start:6872 stop:8176 length:1305 start_codon:yes stop_codon:yes gene_type:complete